jgi:hypothetical protein
MQTKKAKILTHFIDFVKISDQRILKDLVWYFFKQTKV